MALNMGPSCTYDEALRNLYRHTARVFETILMGESRTILKRVKLARQDPFSRASEPSTSSWERA